jgi:cytoskeletal protein CcmA (bactofilin family)
MGSYQDFGDYCAPGQKVMSLKTRCALPFALVVLWIAIPAWAADRDRSAVFHNITVAAGDTAADVACVACNIRIDGTVTGDVAAVAGNIMIRGAVRGDAAAVLGNVRLENGGSIGGDVAVIAGRLVREPGATVGGEVARIPAIWVFLPFLVGIGIIIAIIILIVELFRRRGRTVAAPSH